MPRDAMPGWYVVRFSYSETVRGEERRFDESRRVWARNRFDAKRIVQEYFDDMAGESLVSWPRRIVELRVAPDRTASSRRPPPAGSRPRPGGDAP